MCCAGRWAESPCHQGCVEGGHSGVFTRFWGLQVPRQEQLCWLHSEHPSCPWSAGGSLASCSPGYTSNPELRPSSPPSLNPSPYCAFTPQGWVLGREWFLGTASSWSPQVLLVCSWGRCQQIKLLKKRFAVDSVVAVKAPLGVAGAATDSSAGIFLFPHTGSVLLLLPFCAKSLRNWEINYICFVCRYSALRELFPVLSEHLHWPWM